jgi:hypothetical protein
VHVGQEIPRPFNWRFANTRVVKLRATRLCAKVMDKHWQNYGKASFEPVFLNIGLATFVQKSFAS